MSIKKPPYVKRLFIINVKNYYINKNPIIIMAIITNDVIGPGISIFSIFLHQKLQLGVGCTMGISVGKLKRIG
jgi:hypothetical protein